MKRARQLIAPGPGSGTYSKAPIRRVLTHVDFDGVMLTQRAREVDPLEPAVVALADALVATMRVSPACVGLAAPQIGVSQRVFCMDITGHRKARSCAGLVVMANPSIVARSGNVVMREGCMSVPHLTGDVARASEVVVEGVEPGTGRMLRIEADAMEARCLLHEIDHLDGWVFVERIDDPTARLFARKRYV